MDGSLDGTEATVYKIAFSLIIIVGFIVAATVSLTLANQWKLSLGGSLVVALLLCSLVYWLLANRVSVWNDCAVGLAWPISVGGCD